MQGWGMKFSPKSTLGWTESEGDFFISNENVQITVRSAETDNLISIADRAQIFSIIPNKFTISFFKSLPYVIYS